ncbi:factor activating pos9 [Batrachochytrium dendrobatidis]|nr:factor activating pos9 [Batrachochytrium dendrobatidis]
MQSDSSHEDDTRDKIEKPVRSRPNILITGTPGTGKTTTSELVAIATGLHHLEVGKLVKEKQLHDGFDDTYQSFMINEDKVVDELEEIMAQGGVVVDHHGCDFFPERWFDLVVVLTCNNTTLYDRLQSRGYSDKKIQDNVECEIMQVVADEARESYEANIVIEMLSETVDNMEQNVDRIEAWVTEFILHNGNSVE